VGLDKGRQEVKKKARMYRELPVEKKKETLKARRKTLEKRTKLDEKPLQKIVFSNERKAGHLVNCLGLSRFKKMRGKIMRALGGKGRPAQELWKASFSTASP